MRLEVCNAVLDVWQPTADNKAIINLPSTVQMSMPHVYASQIEYMNEHLKYRENVVLSLHPHNDRGCGISDAEMGILAGADRIEGTLFGNGERTGNVDIVTLALNMYAQGVDPELDFSDMPYISEHYEEYTGMKVDERSPYGGATRICGILRFSSGCDCKGHEVPRGAQVRSPGPFRICRSIRPMSVAPTMRMSSGSTASPERAVSAIFWSSNYRY